MRISDCSSDVCSSDLRIRSNLSRWGRMELQPADELEAPVEQAADAGHQAKREGVAEPQVQFGHVQEIHAVDAGDRGRSEEGRGGKGGVGAGSSVREVYD